MGRCTKGSAAMKGLNMSNSTTRPSATPQETPKPAEGHTEDKAPPEATSKPVPAKPTDNKPPETAPKPAPAGQPHIAGKPATGPAKTPGTSAPGPSDFIDAPGPTASETPDKAPENVSNKVSERIASPVPRHHVPEPGSVDEVLKNPEGQNPPGAPLRHLTDKHAGKGSTNIEGQTVSGGFSGINNWLDSVPEPDWAHLGDKIYAAPSTLKARWLQWRIERAEAAELKERNRLLEVARAEAQAEAAKREAVRLAHQAKLDATAHRAAEAKAAEQDRVEAGATATEEAPARTAEAASSRELLREPEQSGIPETGLVTTGSWTAVASEPVPHLDPEQLNALVASAKAAIDHQQATAEPVYVAPYALPDFSPAPAEEPGDLRRRLMGSASALAAAIVSLVCLGTLVSGQVDSLGSNYSLLSIAPSAHLIWPVIFIWAVLGAAYSWSPSQRSAARQRAVGGSFALACAAAMLWMLSSLAAWQFPAFVFSAASCWFLYASMRELNLKTARTRRERLLTDAPISLMTGFSLVVLGSTFANMLASWGADGLGIWVGSLAVPGLGFLAMTLSMTERGRIILAIGFGWGMFWLLVPRVLGSHHSIWIAILAGMAGFVVLLATENRRYQIQHAEHRAARGKPTDFS